MTTIRRNLSSAFHELATETMPTTAAPARALATPILKTFPIRRLLGACSIWVFCIFTFAPRAALAGDCAALLDVFHGASRYNGIVVTAVSVFSRAKIPTGSSLAAGPQFHSFSMDEGFDSTKPLDPAQNATPSFLMRGHPHPVGTFSQVFSDRKAGAVDKVQLTLRNGGRIILRSITGGFEYELANLSCEQEESRGYRVLVRSRNVWPNYGTDSWLLLMERFFLPQPAPV